MHAASRESLEMVQRRFDELVRDIDASELTTFGDDLGAVTRLLNDQVVLRKHLSDKSDDSTAKVALVDRLLSGKVGSQALDVTRTAVGQRWSSTRDLPNALERCARLAVLIEAEHAGQIEDVEDELFRFGRTLDANPRLASLLSDAGKPLDGRKRLLADVLAGKPSSYTTRLLEQTVELLRGRNIDAVVPELADLAAARRGETVAHVIAATNLSDSQRDRLSEILSRIYGHKMSVQLDVDPEVLGGLQITVGDEVVDGTIVSRLASAASHLPD